MTSIQEVQILKLSGVPESRPDVLAVEEPLEIRLEFGPENARQRQSISITMRTPGHDDLLAIGFLFSEGILKSAQEMLKVNVLENIVTVRLKPEVTVDLSKLSRHVYTSSSCGVCGKTSIDAIQTASSLSLKPNFPQISPDILYTLPQKLRKGQAVFDHTGGLHASGLFDSEGNLLSLYEDVGRHNALDKLIGAALLNNQIPMLDKILLVSGRISFELVQKALIAGIPIIAAVGAPSSLAVALAQTYGQTLIGFLRDTKANVYAGAERIEMPAH